MLHAPEIGLLQHQYLMTKSVSEAKREPQTRYFQLLIARLINNEEISENAQKRDGR